MYVLGFDIPLAILFLINLGLNASTLILAVMVWKKLKRGGHL